MSSAIQSCGVISGCTIACAALALITAGLVIGSCGLAGRVSMTTVSTMTIVTSFVNPVLGLPTFVVGILGATGTITSLSVMSGVLVASQAMNLVVFMVGVVCKSSIDSRGFA